MPNSDIKITTPLNSIHEAYLEIYFSERFNIETVPTFINECEHKITNLERQLIHLDRFFSNQQFLQHLNLMMLENYDFDNNKINNGISNNKEKLNNE
jgi:response regulator of citrate/malate metabolism